MCGLTCYNFTHVNEIFCCVTGHNLYSSALPLTKKQISSSFDMGHSFFGVM